MGKKDTYYRMIDHLEEKFKKRIKTDIYCDSKNDDYYLRGSVLGNKFGIYIDNNEEITTLTNYGKNKEVENILVEATTDFYSEIPNVSYSIKDIIDENIDIKVYEWGCSLKRYNEIQDSKIVSYPRYINNPSITFLYGKDGKAKNLRL